MDDTKCKVSIEDFKLFHGIDRALFCILVQELCREPKGCLQIMALWLWLEHVGFSKFICKVLALPQFLINEIAEEAILCLTCIKDPEFFELAEGCEIPLTHSLMKRELSLQFFYENRSIASPAIKKLEKEVCGPALSDIMGTHSHGNVAESSARNAGSIPVGTSGRPAANRMMVSPDFYEPLIHSFSQLNVRGSAPIFYEPPNHSFSQLTVGGSVPHGWLQEREVPRDERTMFVTFSKGYPVSEAEVREFFVVMFGRTCIESFHMQETRAGEQALYARIVFRKAAFMSIVLGGVPKAKYTINGKHVWMRKFVAKPKSSPQPLPFY